MATRFNTYWCCFSILFFFFSFCLEGFSVFFLYFLLLLLLDLPLVLRMLHVEWVKNSTASGWISGVFLVVVSVTVSVSVSVFWHFVTVFVSCIGCTYTQFLAWLRCWCCCCGCFFIYLFPCSSMAGGLVDGSWRMEDIYGLGCSVFSFILGILIFFRFFFYFCFILVSM